MNKLDDNKVFGVMSAEKSSNDTLVVYGLSYRKMKVGDRVYFCDTEQVEDLLAEVRNV
jgi:hypothetical protein